MCPKVNKTFQTVQTITSHQLSTSFTFLSLLAHSQCACLIKVFDRKYGMSMFTMSIFQSRSPNNANNSKFKAISVIYHYNCI